jgi:hypothetical protein
MASATTTNGAAEQLVPHKADRIQVGTVVGAGIRRGLFRCHVERRANDDARGGPRQGGRAAGIERPRHPEIQDHGPPPGDHDVFGLHVAVHDGPPVGVGQGGEDVPENPDHFVHRNRLVVLQAAAERLPLDEGHGVVAEPVGFPRGEQRHDERVL